MDPIYRINQSVPSSSAQIPFYDPQNGQPRRAPISAIAETVGQMLTTPGAIPGASLVITTNGIPSNDIGADGWFAIDGSTGAMYAKVNGVWTLKAAGSTAPALEVEGTAVTVGQAGVPFAGFVIQATGGKAPYTYADPAGTLPAGLSIHPTVGLVYGTPTAWGETGLIVLTATDATGKMALFQPFRMDIEAPDAVLEISGTPLLSATAGVPYSWQPVVVGGTTPYARTISGQPVGMTFDQSGVIWPNPVEGTYPGIVVGAIDAAGTVVTLPPFTLSVSAAVSVGQLSLDAGDILVNDNPLLLIGGALSVSDDGALREINSTERTDIRESLGV